MMVFEANAEWRAPVDPFTWQPASLARNAKFTAFPDQYFTWRAAVSLSAPDA